MMFLFLILILTPSFPAIEVADATGVIRINLIANERGLFARLSDAHDKNTSYSLSMGMGTPPQSLNILLDSTVSDFWLISSKCKDPACKRHKTYDSSKSTSYVKNGARSFNLYESFSGFLSRDHLTIGNLSVKDLTFGEADHVHEDVPWRDAIFGLGIEQSPKPRTDNVINKMIQQNLLAEQSVSFYLASPGTGSATDELEGEVMFGGADSKYYSDNITYLSCLESRKYIEFYIDTLSAPSANSSNVYACKKHCVAMLLTTYSSIIGPSYEIHQLNRALGAKKSDRFDDWTFPGCDLSKLRDVTFELGGKKFIMRPEHYVERTIKDKEQVCTSIFKAGPKTWYGIGYRFMSAIYTVIDYKNNKIGFAQGV